LQRQVWITNDTFHADVQYIETLWKRHSLKKLDLPLIDIGQGMPLVFVPILEHLEFVYARQVRSLSQARRVVLYRRRETRQPPAISLQERAEELREVLDSLYIDRADLAGHGDAAMVLLTFALRYPQRCRSLIIISQGADYQISPHPLIWLLHELLLRLPIEGIVPTSLLQRTVINYITSCAKENTTAPALPRRLIEEQFHKIQLWPLVYKYSILPVIHTFDIRKQLAALSTPVLLINRADDALAPEAKTAWMAQQLPDCRAYHVVPGRERFFLYSQAEVVTPLLHHFLEQVDHIGEGKAV